MDSRSASSPSGELVSQPVSRLAAAGLGLALLVPPGLVARGPVLCPVRRLTGVPCPGCGLTRSIGLLLHGRIREATNLHPFSPLVLATLVGFAVRPEPGGVVGRWVSSPQGRNLRRASTVAVGIAWGGWAIARARAARSAAG
jgi:hypothetical protein